MKILECASRSESVTQASPHSVPEVPPETEAVVQALLTSIAGHEVKLRSVRLIEDSGPANSWATQGRVAVQMSHNQRISHE
jgi:hypothetical protein